MKKTVHLFIISSVILLTGCQFFSKEKSVNNMSDSGNAEATQEETNNNSFSGNYFDLMARGGSFQCQWTTTTDSDEVSGKTYVDGERLRSEVSMTDPATDEPMTVYTIFDSEYIYSWTSQSNTGTKFAQSTFKELGEGSSDSQFESPGSSQDYSQEVDFDCDSWSPDESLITPPNSIEFQDMSALMNQTFDSIKETLPESVDIQDSCSFCSQLPDGQARQACLDNC